MFNSNLTWEAAVFSFSVVNIFGSNVTNEIR